MATLPEISEAHNAIDLQLKIHFQPSSLFLPSISSIFIKAPQASTGSVGTRLISLRLKFNGLPKSLAGRTLYEYAISEG